MNNRYIIHIKILHREKISLKNKTIIENDYIKKTKNKSRKFKQNDIMIFYLSKY